ncbi:carbohydrate kinase family protein [Luedemannella helvata]|uniref:carbohydrate kinase family protein n=1 Tax=Luedemannella helvata TaxID=349315 RepID=UPI0031DCC1C6
MTRDVVVIGGTGVDTIVRVPSLPVPFADSVMTPGIRDWAGHTGYGVALGCQSLGLATTLVDFIGEDPQGDLVRAECRRRNVDLRFQVSPLGTRRAVNLVDEQGRRMSLYDARDSPDLRLPREFYLPYVRAARHVHLSIMDFARHLFDDLLDLGVPTSTDLHDWDGHDPYHWEFARQADVVTLSLARISDRFREVMGRIVAEGRAQVVIATAGAEGCYVLARGQDGVRHVPAATPPRPVVDSNGAGDAFVSGFLYGRLAGWPLEQCVRAGTVAGAHACGAEGTHADVIDAAGLLAAVA